MLYNVLYITYVTINYNVKPGNVNSLIFFFGLNYQCTDVGNFDIIY